jgi:hypothetical protein
LEDAQVQPLVKIDLANFLPGLASNHDPGLHLSIARITGLSYRTWPLNFLFCFGRVFEFGQMPYH